MQEYTETYLDYVVFKIPEHSNEPFHRALRKLMIAKNITTTMLAHKFKRSSTTINKYLIGEFKPKDDFMIEVALFFDINPNYFREFRLHKLIDKLYDRPTLIDIFLDITNSPDTNKMLREYSEYKKIRDNYNSYKKDKEAVK